MTYHVEIEKKAKKELDRLPINTQERIAEGIGLLGANPDNPALDIKKLKNDKDLITGLELAATELNLIATMLSE